MHQEQVQTLINASTSDAKAVLDSMIQHDPNHAKQIALGMLKALKGREEQTTHKSIANAAVRKVNRQLGL